MYTLASWCFFVGTKSECLFSSLKIFVLKHADIPSEFESNFKMYDYNLEFLDFDHQQKLISTIWMEPEMLSIAFKCDDW